MSTADERFFEAALKEKLGNFYERALAVFKKYGESLSYDVTNVLMHAVDKGKVGEVLQTLEDHWSQYLCFQHPDVRGTIRDFSGVNPTEEMFLKICRDVLGLKPTTS